MWLCSVEWAEPPGQLCELEFFHCGASDYRVCLSSVGIRLAGFGRCSVLQFVAGDTWLNKIRRVFILVLGTCWGRDGIQFCLGSDWSLWILRTLLHPVIILQLNSFFFPLLFFFRGGVDFRDNFFEWPWLSWTHFVDQVGLELKRSACFCFQITGPKGGQLHG